MCSKKLQGGQQRPPVRARPGREARDQQGHEERVQACDQHQALQER